MNAEPLAVNYFDDMPKGAFNSTLNLSSYAMMRAIVPISILLGGLAIAGCKKADSAAKTTETTGTEAQTSAGASAAAPIISDSAPIPAAPPPSSGTVVPITPSDPSNMETTLADLTQALRKYSFEKRQMPKSFSEVVAAGYVQPVPLAPAGKKFEIDPKTKRVTLMNQ
jgi:hypothetical protein